MNSTLNKLYIRNLSYEQFSMRSDIDKVNEKAFMTKSAFK